MGAKVTTLYEDSSKTEALYPRTKVSAVSDGSGNGLDALLNGKQDTLVSGTNIKTINSTSILGSGNMDIGMCDLLWTNANTTDGVLNGPFDAQKLSFSTIGYKAFLVGASTCDGSRRANICWNYVVNDQTALDQSIKDGGWFNKNNSQIYSTNNCRFVTLIEDDGITISNGPQGSGSNYRYFAIPWKIYGIK